MLPVIFALADYLLYRFRKGRYSARNLVDVESWFLADQSSRDVLKTVRSGAAVGQPCELLSGGQRHEPHADRKYEAAEALENNANQMDA
jgi:hypothetical protein